MAILKSKRKSFKEQEREGTWSHQVKKRLQLFSGNWYRGWCGKAQGEAAVKFASGLVGMCSVSERISTRFKIVVLKVCSLAGSICIPWECVMNTSSWVSSQIY